MSAHTGSKVRFDNLNILYSYDSLNKAKDTFAGAPITNYAHLSTESTQGTAYTARRLPGQRQLRKMTKHLYKPIYIYNSTSDWVDVKRSNAPVMVLPGASIIVSVYVMPLSSNNRFNCQLVVNNVNTNMGIPAPEGSHDLPKYKWTRLWFRWTNNTGSSQLVSQNRIETYTNEEWSGSKVKVIAVNYQVEMHTAESGIIKPTPYMDDQSRTNTGKSLFSKRSISFSNTGFTPDGKTPFFRGQGEIDGSPTGDYLPIPAELCTTNPAVRPNGVTYTWWQYAKDLNRRSLFFGAGTINHIEQMPPNFRTEARLRNGHSFGASGANQVANKWEHYAIVFDNTNLKARWYKNGQLFHTGNLLNASGQHDYFEPNNIGRATGTTNYKYARSWYGYFDCFYVYDGQLDQSQIQKVYNVNRKYFSNRTMP